jgi:hypothetical protein
MVAMRSSLSVEKIRGIGKFAAAKEIDLIVIGTREKRGWSAFFSGVWQKKISGRRSARCS